VHAGDCDVDQQEGYANRAQAFRAIPRLPRHSAPFRAFCEGVADLGVSYDQPTTCLGGGCYDFYASDLAYWRCVPARVWKYTMGGYQVMKKWRRAASPPSCCSSRRSTPTTSG
jgi:hypothetical protein